jgi:hypothetical protein
MKKITYLILLVALLLSACSRHENTFIDQGEKREISSSNIAIISNIESTVESGNSDEEDLNNDGIHDHISLSYNNNLIVKVNSDTLNLCKFDLIDENIKPTFKVIEGNESKKFILVYYECPTVGDSEFHVFLLKYDNDISLLWNGQLPEYEYKYNKNKVYFTYLENHKTSSTDISAIAKSLSTRKALDKNGNFVLISVDDFLNGPIITYISNLNIRDYDGDGIDEIVTSNEILNKERASYLSTLYTSWEVNDDKIQVMHYILAYRNTMDFFILRKIMNDSYLDKEKLQDFINEYADVNDDNVKIDKDYTIDHLLDNGTLKLQDSKYIIN